MRSDGTLFSWGDNTSGALGNGTSGGFSATPAPVPGLTGLTQVAMGEHFLLAAFSAAVRSDGTLRAWGSDVFGQLGYGAVGSAISIRIGSVPRPPRECP